MATTKRKKPSKTVFVFYRGNKTAGRFEMTLDEIKEGYRAWCARTPLSYLEYYGGQTVATYITAIDGLNSTFERTDFNQLDEELEPIRHEFYKD